MEKLLPVNKHNKTTRTQMSHNILYKKIIVHNSFYKLVSRRMAWGIPLHSPTSAQCTCACNAIRIPQPIPEATTPSSVGITSYRPLCNFPETLLLTAPGLASRTMPGT